MLRSNELTMSVGIVTWTRGRSQCVRGASSQRVEGVSGHVRATSAARTIRTRESVSQYSSHSVVSRVDPILKHDAMKKAQL